MKILCSIILILILVSIFGYFIKTGYQTKFSKDKWCYKSDLEYPYRNEMIKDLLANHKLIGLKYQDLINLIGTPESNYTNNDHEIYYEIEIKFGINIDPISSKTLGFKLSKDSLITNYKLYIYKK